MLDASESLISRVYTEKNVADILHSASVGQQIDPDEARILLNANPDTDNGHFKNILDVSRKAKVEIFCGEIYPIAPLYVSSICQEHCVYCNYRAENADEAIRRVRLSDKELAIEVRFLADKGLRIIELVYATDPLITADKVASHIKIAHEILLDFGGGVVGINARPYSVKDYSKLKESGLNFAVLWQETYDENCYRSMHPREGEKSNFYYRLSAPERMLQAGIDNIGLGILSGLSNWRDDWYQLMRHVNYLLRKYEGKVRNVILGIPRLKPATGALLKHTPFILSDREYLLAISVFNLFLPKALPFVNTRENWDMCTTIAQGGGVLFTFNCRTIPGGYAHGYKGEQFPTYDFDICEYTNKLRYYNLKPCFSGWSRQCAT